MRTVFKLFTLFVCIKLLLFICKHNHILYGLKVKGFDRKPIHKKTILCYDKYMQNILSEHNFSLVVAVSSLILFIFSVKVFAWYHIFKSMRSFIDSIGYFVWMKIIFLISLTSIVGALIYQEIYNTPVCPLCWQQRMLIYAVAIVSGVSIYFKDKLAHYSILIISVFGFYIAAGHYYYHYLKYVVNNPLALPCDAEGISCTESPIGAVFGFVTIPLMSLCVFTPFLIAGYFAWKKSKSMS